MFGKLSLCLAFLITVSSCQNVITPIDSNISTNNTKKNTKNILKGKVEFPSKFTTKAVVLGDIITNSTVSLIYPKNYQTENLRNKSIATGLSDANGNFSLNADYSFDPIVGQIFILEATKRVNSEGGDAISIRTYVRWDGSSFKSITKNSIYINTITTAVAIMADFNTILPEDTIEKLDIDSNGQTQISDITFQYENSSKTITSSMIEYLRGLVDISLSKEQDPIGSIYYQQNKFLMKDILPGSINKLRGCISTSGNCNGLNVNIPTVTSLGNVANTAYVFRTEDIKVNTTTIGNQTDPAIAVNRTGSNKVVTWVSNDGNGNGIFAQRYDSNGAKIGGEILVNTSITGEQFNEYGCKNVAISDDGSFMVVWTESDSSLYGVFGQKFNADGSKNGSSFTINDFEDNEQRYPSISARGNGDYVVTWSSLGQDGSAWGIYAKQYFSNGEESDEIAVNSETYHNQINSDVAVDFNGNFVITWASVNGIWNIYAQKFNADGSKNGVTIDVNSSGDYLNTNPSVAIDSNNNFVITWYGVVDFTYGFDIMARRFNSSGALGNDFVVSSDMRIGDHANSKISMNDSGNFVISWLDVTGNDGSGYGVHAKKYDTNGNAVGEDFIVNKFRRKDQKFPLVSIDNSNKYSIVWASDTQDNNQYGIYMQNFNFADSVNYSPISGNSVQTEGCINEGGICLKGEQQINSFTLGNQQEVSTATNKTNGDHVAVWVSELQDGSGNGIFAQMYTSTGQKKGKEIQVNGIINDEQTVMFGSRSVGMDNLGNFIVVWMSKEAGNWQIRLQKFNSSGIKVGSELRVNDTIGTDKMYPSISVNSSGQYLITWSSQGVNSWDIYAKKFDTNDSSIPEFKVNTTVAGDQMNSDAYLDNNASYTIVWGSSQNATWESFAQRYNSDNTQLNSEFRINEAIGAENFNPTVIKDSTGKNIFTWHRQTTTGTGYDVIARTMDISGVLSSEFVITNALGEQGNPKIALLPSDKFIITWNDLSNLDGTGKKVNARIFDSNFSPIGNEINVNTFTGNNQYTSLGANQALPKVATDSTGAFNIVWTSEGQDGSGKSVHIKRFNSNGTEK